jgi:hypothetical protein
MMCAVALMIPSAGTALAQDSIPPVPGIEFPFFFDDFDYPADAVTPSPPSDPFVFRHPDRSLFGDNLWLTAGGPNHDLTIERTRAWYEHDWLEYPGDGHIWGYVNPPGDRSWFDPAGVHLSGDLETIMNGTGKLRELSTGARAFDPNFVLFRAEKGDFSDRIASLRISSGFVAQTGTWVARILLPDFDGLRHHDQVDGSAADISFVPAFWLQSSEYFLEEREPMFPRPEDLPDPSQAHDSWSEANFEFNNWYNPDGSEGHKSISRGPTRTGPTARRIREQVPRREKEPAMSETMRARPVGGWRHRRGSASKFFRARHIVPFSSRSTSWSQQATSSTISSPGMRTFTMRGPPRVRTVFTPTSTISR